MGGVMKNRLDEKGFTIVELLIVVVVIAILAAITIVAYNGIRDRAQTSALQNSLAQAFRKVEVVKNQDGAYPADLASIGFVNGGGITYDYRTYGYGSCVSGTQNGKTYHVSTDNSAATYGSCGQVKAEYFNNQTLAGSPTLVKYENSMTNVWNAGSPEAGTIGTDNFSSRFTSYIVPPETAAYTFSFVNDDYGRLFIDGVNVLDNFTAQLGGCCNPYTSTTPVNLTAGVPVRVVFEHREGAGGAYAQLQWAYGGVARSHVPASVFVRLN